MAMVTVHPFVDEGLGHSSYLIDLGDGRCALVDPPRFPLQQRARAAELDLAVAWTLDTHSHADYITGSPGLVARDGAVFLAPEASGLETPHRGLRHGDQVELANGVRVTAIATPGHTPDHHSYLLEEGGQPVGLFTGGSLMVGTVGRTDLCGPDLAVPLAHGMYRSLRRFDPLPDELAVYPTHGAGSFCSAPGTSERTSTLGRERATNPLFTLDDEDEFVARLVAGFGTFPTYFSQLPERNRRGPSRLDRLPPLPRLDVAAVERHRAGGAQVVDTRPMTAFGAGHIPGALANTLRPVFGTWLGWLVEAGRPLVFVMDAGQDRAELVRQCLDVGHEALAGELAGGITSWQAAGRPLASIGVVDALHLWPNVADVRQANEFAAGHLPGAVNVELGAVATTELPPGPVTVMCGHGERAMTAASLLAGTGRELSVLDGGPDSWSAATGLVLQAGR